MVVRLLASAAVLPLGTAEVEFFSQLKLVKTGHRSCLKTSTLTKLLNVKLNCTDELFKTLINSMANNFFIVKSRRILSKVNLAH